MKKWIVYALPILVIVVALLLYQQPARPLVQVGLKQGPITMVPSTIPVDAVLQQRIAKLLEADASTRGVFTYAITNITQQDGYLAVSVAGLPSASTSMHLSDAVWLGVVTVTDTPTYAGGIVDDVATGDAIAPSAPEGGGGGAILPFRSGTTAIYGGRAVHDCGFSLNGWKAVDIIPSENMVYASTSGNVSYVCRDDTQVAVRTGENLYTHLVDGGQQVGDSYTQGQQISSMVTGTFDKPCGWAEQGASNFHVHFCFIPHSGQGWSADGYVLSMITEHWVKGEENVAPLGTLTADWQDAGVSPPTVGSNFFDGLASGLTQLIGLVVPLYPEHEAMGITDRVMTTAAPVMTLVHTIAFRVFDMTIPLWIFGIIMLLEAVRIIYSIYMWIKRAIPVIG